MVRIENSRAKSILEEQFSQAERLFLQGESVSIDDAVLSNTDIMFRSRTQAYRETIIGCLIARIIDKTIDIYLPYINLGENAYNGRTLDEQVVNPFLQEKRIPCSKGPFLSVFRRFGSVQRHNRKRIAGSGRVPCVLGFCENDCIHLR
jgi:hypothetical protein